jgi:hypothetical protein
MLNPLSLFAAAAVAAAAPIARTAPDPTLRLVHARVVYPDSARIAASLAEAERFAAAGRLADARRRYRDVIEQQRTDDDYPAQAMWRLANAWFGDGNELEAARVLDDLAAAAAEYGDPRMELRASLEGAVLYSRHRRPERVAALLVRVRKLLKSPAIDDELKGEARRRIAG